MLIGIHLQNYGVLHDTAVGMLLQDLRTGQTPREIIEPGKGAISIRPISALIGRNSTGKSSLLDALSFLADFLRHGVQFAASLNGRGGFAKMLTFGDCKDIQFDLLLEMEDGSYYLNYLLTASCDGHGRPYISAEKVVRADLSGGNYRETLLLDLHHGKGQIREAGEVRPAGVNDLVFPALAAYGSLLTYPELQALNNEIAHWYFCQYNKHPADRPRQQSTGGHKHLNPSCDNIANVLAYYQEEHPDEYRQIIDRISTYLPDQLPGDDEFLKGHITSGNLKLFTYLLLLEDPHPRPLLCLEEPDAGLYHDMVELLALKMREYTLRNPGCQIIFTTHNPYILESMHPDEVWVFERRDIISHEAQTDHFAKARCVGQDPLVAAMYKQGVGMGALWYSGHLDQLQEE